MRMYAVKEIERHFGDSSTTYHHTLEEAEARIDASVMHDSKGEHPGREWLAIFIVERVSQPCKSCGRETENKPESYAEFPYCRGCYYTGSAADDEHLNDLCAFRSAFPDAEYVGVEHTGGGCFWLAFRWEGDPFYYVATDGEAGLPDDNHGGWAAGWGYVGRHFYDDDVIDHPDEHGTVLREAVPAPYEEGGKGLTKRQIIAAIKKDRKARASVPA